MRLLHATLMFRRYSASMAAGTDLDACGGSYLVRQRRFNHGDDSAGMETHSRVNEYLWQNPSLN